MSVLAPPGLLRRQIPSHGLVFIALLAIVGLFVLYPVLIILVNSVTLGPNGQSQGFTLRSWQIAVSDPAMLAAIRNTLKVVAANESISLPVAVAIAWLLARTDLPARATLEFMFWVTFFLPSLSVTLGWVVLLDAQSGVVNQLAHHFLPSLPQPLFNIHSFWGVVWAHLSTGAISVKVILLTPALRNLDASFEEAARICGAARWRTLTRIVVPVAAPAILTVMVLSIIRAMQTFEIEMALGPPFNFWVFGTMIYRLAARVPPDLGPATALAALAFLALTPLIILHRYLITRKDYATVGGKLRVAPTPLGRWRFPIFGLVCLFVFLVTVLPVVFVILSSFMKLFGFFDIPDPWTLDNWRNVLRDDFFLRAFAHTFEIAGVAAVGSMLLSGLTAHFIVRSRYWGRGILDFVSWLPFAIPGILFSVGMLYVVLSNPVFRIFYGSLPLMMLTIVIANMTLGIQILKAAIIQIGGELEQAARTTGASWWYAFRKVILPILMPTLILVGMITFIGATREIASVALLATNETKTLSLLQLDYITDGRFEAAAVISALVVMLTVGIAFVARFLGLRAGIRAS